jgi:hypothetical protein
MLEHRRVSTATSARPHPVSALIPSCVTYIRHKTPCLFHKSNFTTHTWHNSQTQSLRNGFPTSLPVLCLTASSKCFREPSARFAARQSFISRTINDDTCVYALDCRILNLYPTNVQNWASSYQYSNIRVHTTRCNVTHFIYIWKLLYMFRVVLPPIVRSACSYLLHLHFS